MFLCAIPLISGLFTFCAAPMPLATGYVEGDYVLIAPLAIAQISTLSVSRGDHVAAGTLLVEMDHRDAEIALAEAEAARARAASQLENLRLGKRPEEIRVIEAALASARAQTADAERARARTESLHAKGAATDTQRDDAATRAEVARAREAEIEANLAVARLPARPEEITAAEAALRGADAGLARAQWALEQRHLSAPAAGTISDVLRHPGELAGPSAPILSLLPDGGVKLRLYVPETAVARLHPGLMLTVGCDGCAEGLMARVTYVSDTPEFTPPVIYSLQNRQKLVYLIEAVPADGSALKPGQIVDVALPEEAGE